MLQKYLANTTVQVYLKIASLGLPGCENLEKIAREEALNSLGCKNFKNCTRGNKCEKCNIAPGECPSVILEILLREKKNEIKTAA